MMKILKISLFPVALLLLFSCTDKKEFQGHIVYQVNAEKKDASIPDEFLSSIGDQSTFYYEDGSYFQTHENSILEFGFLDFKLKQVGVKYRKNDTLFVYDATKSPSEKLLKTETVLSNQDVLGYTCNQFNIYTQNESAGYDENLTFYYSNQIKIDGRKFDGIKYQFADQVYAKINSIPLSFEIDNPIFFVQYVAKKIAFENPVPVAEMIEKNKKGLIVKMMN